MKIDLHIDGMTCSGCAASVRRVLEAVPLVRSVAVDLDAGRAAIEADAAVDVDRIVTGVEDAGYEVRIVGPS
jgi:copper chaperone CopZ